MNGRLRLLQSRIENFLRSEQRIALDRSNMGQSTFEFRRGMGNLDAFKCKIYPDQNRIVWCGGMSDLIFDMSSCKEVFQSFVNDLIVKLNTSKFTEVYNFSGIIFNPEVFFEYTVERVPHEPTCLQRSIISGIPYEFGVYGESEKYNLIRLHQHIRQRGHGH